MQRRRITLPAALTSERERVHTAAEWLRANLSVVAGRRWGDGQMGVTRISVSLVIFSSIVHCNLPAQAHDIYAHLTDRLGRSCCDNGDCRPAHYRIGPYGVQMLIGERWIAIPRGKLQFRILEGDSGETGGAHWCGAPDEGHSYFT